VNKLSVKAAQKKYVAICAISILFIALAQVLSVNPKIVAWVPQLIWQILTGSTLFAIFIFQWLLFYVKWNGKIIAVRTQSRIHHWSGLLAVMVFALHSQSVGYSLTLVLFAAIVGIAITGLLNEKFFNYPRQRIKQFILWSHIAIAAAAMPLILLHAIVALTFE